MILRKKLGLPRNAMRQEIFLAMGIMLILVPNLGGWADHGRRLHLLYHNSKFQPIHRWEQRIKGEIRSVSDRLTKVTVAELGHLEDMIISIAIKDHARADSALITVSG